MNILRKLMIAAAIAGLYLPGVAQNSVIYQHKADQNNIQGHLSEIDDPLFNEKEFLYPVFTHANNPGGGLGKAQSKYTSMYYADKTWFVYHEDLSNFSENTYYNVFVPGIGSTSWKHLTTDNNITNNYSIIDHPKINGDSNAKVFVSHVFNTNGAVGSYHLHNIGVFYSISEKKWAVFNEDQEDMVKNIAFNIVVIPSNSDVEAFLHLVDGSGSDGYTSALDDEYLNGNPNAKIIVTQLYNPGGSAAGKYNDHPVGVFYDGTRWNIYNEDNAYFNIGTAFNVMIIDDKQSNITDKEIMEIPSLRIGPNPVVQGESFTIGLYNENNEELVIELIDLQGKVVMTETLNGQHVIIHRFSTAGLPQGVYLLTIKSDRLNAVRRIIIE